MLANHSTISSRRLKAYSMVCWFVDSLHCAQDLGRVIVRRAFVGGDGGQKSSEWLGAKRLRKNYTKFLAVQRSQGSTLELGRGHIKAELRELVEGDEKEQAYRKKDEAAADCFGRGN
jgi:hypothetical protein